MNTDTYTKAQSTTGTIHLAAEGSAEAACASGKARPLVTPLTADEQGREITCKRCVKIALKLDAARIAAAADTAAIDALLAEANSVQDITAALEAGLAEMAEAAEGEIDEATASDTEAAEEAAERDAAEAPVAAAAAPDQRVRANQKELVMGYLTANPAGAFTPHEISKAVTPAGAKALGLRDCLARLAKDGKVAVKGDKPVKYGLAAAAADALLVAASAE